MRPKLDEKGVLPTLRLWVRTHSLIPIGNFPTAQESNMKRHLLPVTAACLFATQIAACGAEQRAALQADDLYARPSQAALSEACDHIWKQLEADREALMKTEAWEALHQTTQFEVFRGDLRRASEAGCKPFDKAPSLVCDVIGKQMGADWQAVKATPEY
ncbi:MAG: hypothetical protein EOO40_08905, partial [Deltaproteobacteria bacterium]